MTVAIVMCAVHELGHTEMPKAIVFRGDRSYDVAATSSALGIGPGSGQRCGHFLLSVVPDEATKLLAKPNAQLFG